MASVDGITVAKATAIENASVVTGTIDPTTGHLLLTTHGGTVIDAGVARPDAAIAAAVLVETNNRITDVNTEESARIAADATHVTALHTDTGWLNLTFTSPWAGGPVQYRKIYNRVYLRGSAARPSGSSGTVGTLPVGFRPTQSANMITREQSTSQSVAVSTNGDIVAGAGYTNTNTIYFDNISFFID